MTKDLRATLRRALSSPETVALPAPARAAHTALTEASLAAVLLRDRLRIPAPTAEERADAAEHLTIVIKTFMRPKTCRRFLRSVRAVFDGRIIVVDDSPTPMSAPDERVTVIPMPVNSGVPVGRNRGLDAVDTEFVLITDDDHVFSRATRLAPPIAYLRQTPEADLVGLGLVKLPGGTISDIAHSRMTDGALPALRPHDEDLNGLPVRLMVSQNYIARTDSVRRVGWDEGVRMSDHLDFFNRASGRLVCVMDFSSWCYHLRTPFNREYMRHRQNMAADSAYLMRKWAAVAAGEAPSDVTRWAG